mmetsp:Transcript_148435/g.259426  ORF Transcript_148435/g.259426 Transcript_148435/m.259426 type:complete len:94 (-) Transcript_148435:540-821(-)
MSRTVAGWKVQAPFQLNQAGETTRWRLEEQVGGQNPTVNHRKPSIAKMTMCASWRTEYPIQLIIAMIDKKGRVGRLEKSFSSRRLPFLYSNCA